MNTPTRRDWVALAVLATGLGLIVLDGTIVNVALPDIISELDMSLSQAQWVTSLYAVLLAAILLVTGTLADRIGRRTVFQIGLLVFAAGSIFAASSTAPGILITARAVQALGAGCIMPSTLSTVNATFRGKYRAAAFGVWGAVISGAAAVGPLAGGALTEYASWQWIFWVNVPIVAVLFVVAIFTVPRTYGELTGSGFDGVGVVLSAVGLGALVFAVIEGPTFGWWRPAEDLSVLGLTWPQSASVSVIPVLLVVAAASLIGFVLWERRRKARAQLVLLELTLFRLPTFSWGNITAMTVMVGEFALVFVLPLYLVNAVGLSIMSAGVVLAAMAVGAFVSGALARVLAAKMGPPGVVLLGLGMELAGVVILTLIVRPDTTGWIIALPLVLYGLGLGLASAQLTGTVLRDVPVAQSGQGSATQSTIRQVGSGLGTAFAGTALSVALAITLPGALADAGLSGSTADSFAASTRSSAGSVIAQLRSMGSASPFGEQTDSAVAALSSGFADATRLSFAVAAVFLIAGVIGAVRVWAVARREQADAPRENVEQ